MPKQTVTPKSLVDARRAKLSTNRIIDNFEYDPDDVAHILLPADINTYIQTEYSDIPVGFALIGGAARDIAFGVVKGHEGMKVRDVDLVAFRERVAVDGVELQSQLADMSTRYMPDDVAFGHGVRLEGRSRYFQTRDFTINQVAVSHTTDGWVLEMTRQAAIDTDAVVIRPTVAVHDTVEDRWLSDKLAIKAVLLEQVLASEGLKPSIRGIDLRNFSQHGEVFAFHLGLGLQKACEWGDTIPIRYVQALRHYGFVDARIRTVTDLVRYVEQESDFIFRGIALDVLNVQDRRVALSQRVGDAVISHSR